MVAGTRTRVVGAYRMPFATATSRPNHHLLLGAQLSFKCGDLSGQARLLSVAWKETCAMPCPPAVRVIVRLPCNRPSSSAPTFLVCLHVCDWGYVARAQVLWNAEKEQIPCEVIAKSHAIEGTALTVSLPRPVALLAVAPCKYAFKTSTYDEIGKPSRLPPSPTPVHSLPRPGAL